LRRAAGPAGRAKSQYERNTATVVTILTADDGAQVKITDFAPRLRNFDRLLKPPQLMRIIDPLRDCRASPCGFAHAILRQSHQAAGGGVQPYHLWRAVIAAADHRRAAFLYSARDPLRPYRPLHLVFGPDESFMGDISSTVRDFCERTRAYWLEWVRRLSIAYEWQEASIRAAITLKLMAFEETGGIVAALTTSLPEAPHSGRNWDYRYCWLRDAYFVVKALNAIGVTETMEQYIAYILSIAGNTDVLAPCYGIVPRTISPNGSRPI
jgi:hypothetical protein